MILSEKEKTRVALNNKRKTTKGAKKKNNDVVKNGIKKKASEENNIPKIKRLSDFLLPLIENPEVEPYAESDND